MCALLTFPFFSPVVFLLRSTTSVKTAGLSIDLSLSDLNSTSGYKTLLTSARFLPPSLLFFFSTTPR